MSLALARRGNGRKRSNLSYKDTVLLDNPSQYLRLADTSGTVAAAEVGSNGTYVNAPTLGQTSLLTSDPADKSIDLDGTNDYVTAPSDANTILGNTLSVEFWMKPDAIPTTAGTWRSILHRYDSYGFQFVGSNNTLNFFVETSGGQRNCYVANSMFTLGSIYHIVGTYDGTFTRVYVNGAQANIAGGTGSVTNGAQILRIGSWNGSIEFFDGRMDEVALYKTVLTPERILAHYNKGIAAP